MTKSVTTKYNFWLSGYYDDFASARCVADNLNAANTRTLDHTKTHFGSAIGSNARLNPRFKYSLPDRTRTGTYLLDDPSNGTYTHLGSNITSTTAVTDALTHNSSIADWLKYDIYRDNEDSITFSQSSPKHPSSVLANRQRFAGVAGDSYLTFVNGHDTSGKYYCPVGDMDFSWAAAPHIIGNSLLKGASTTSSVHSGSPISFRQIGIETTNYPSHNTADGVQATVSFASVYISEEPNTDTTDNRPDSYSQEVTSPSGNNFFIHNLYIPRGSGMATPSTTSGTIRVMAYDGPIRMKGLGESFHLRLCVDKPTQDIDIDYTLKIGYKSTATYDKSTNDFSDTTTVATIPIDFGALAITGDLRKYQNSIPIAIDLTPQQLWVDVEVVFDFSLNRWKAYTNGSTTEFASDAINVTVDELTCYGWSLDANWEFNSIYYGNVVTMIDRAAMALPLTNKFDGSVPAPIQDFALNKGINKISSARITILDDSNSYNLAALTTGLATTEWKLLCFLDNEDRPFWQGVVNSISHKQDSKGQILNTTVKANDSLSILDRTLPIWELGQNSYISLNDHISMASTVEKRVEETTALANTLLMGNGNMGHKGVELGYNYYDTEKYATGFSPIANGRTQLYSGTAIQMYINEDDDGPNDAENEWEGDDVLEIIGHHPHNTHPNPSGGNTSDREFIVKFDERLYTTALVEGMQQPATYHNLGNGDTFVVEGTAYDGVYTVRDIKLIHDPTSDPIRWAVRIITTDTSAAESLEKEFAIDEMVMLSSYNGKKLIKMTMDGAHGLEIGDEFYIPTGVVRAGASGDLHFFAGRPLQVLHVVSSTILHVLVDKWPYAIGDNQTLSGSFRIAYDLSKINGKDAKSYPKTPAVLYKQNTITNQGPQVYAKHSRIHARWMRDLPQSTWFKAQFGVIAAAPYWRHGIGSFMHTPFTAAAAALHVGWNADGTTKTPTMVSDLTTASTSLTLNDPAMWWHIKQNRLKEFIIDLVDKDTGDHQYIIGNAVTTPSGFDTVVWDAGGYFETPSAHGFEEGEIVVHTRFTQANLNGPHMIKQVVSATEYTTFEVEQFNATQSSFAYLKSKLRGTSNWNDGISRWYEDPDAITATLTQPPTTTGETGGAVYSGNCILNGLKGVKRDWNRANTIYSLRKVDESNGYKHCWVLWADMRNDGKADADGGYRKEDFGLILPTTQNYEVNLTFANQIDEYGLPDSFCDLKVGEDLDIWSLDSTEEPFTGNAWETLEGGSNEEPFDQYHNWKDKGGAVCLVDVSRFWNLNTMATGGRPGYQSGGLADFGDYETDTHGFPYLIDNYWKHAVTNYKNIAANDTYFMKFHSNANNFINDGTVLMRDVVVGDTDLVIQDSSLFQTTGYGVIQCTGGSGRDSEKTNYYMYWSGKSTFLHSNGNTYDKLTGVYITSYEIVTGPKHVIEQLEADSSLYSNGSGVAIASNEFLTTDVEGNFDSVRVYNTPAALFSFRLLMNVSGLVKSPNSGTFFAHDKLRYMQTLLLTDNWSTNANLPCIWDLANVPKTRNLGGDNYGSVHDARGQTIMDLLNDMRNKDGNGISGGLKTFSWMIGRDNRLDFRESYASGHTFDRNNLKISDLSTQGGGKITNVRVYYNGNSAFADYPTPSGTDLRWKVLNYEKVFNKDEALALAKQEYHRENTSRISVNAEIIRPDADLNIMTSGGRYGYVADVCRNLVHGDRWSMAWWTNTLGGQPFYGIQNALDSGALNAAASPTDEQVYAFSYDNTAANAEHPTEHQIRLGTVAGIGLGATLPTSGHLDKVSHSPLVYRWSYSGTTNYGANVTFAANDTWYELESTVSGVDYTLSVYNINAGNASASDFTVYYENCIRRDGSAYYWYGTNSLVPAVQVVHVDKDTRKTSSTTGNNLRLAIAYDSGSTAQTSNFRLFALDYVFDEVIHAPAPGAERPPLFGVSSLAGSSSVVLNGNGMFELTLPSTYDSNTPKVIFSVDIDYLRDVMDKRMSTTTPKNAHNIPSDTTYSSFDTLSPFPLGVRQHSDMGPMADSRAAYYAPRLHIVDDLNFIPATTVSYTDTHIDLTSETMVIRDIAWTQSGNKHEKVSLKLEKLDNHYAYSMAQVFARGGTGSGGGESGTPPGPIGPASPLPGGGFGGTVDVLPQLSTVWNMNEDGQNQFTGLTSNQMSKGLIRALKGRSDFSGDRNSSNANWGVLGSKSTGPASSFDRAIDGLDTHPHSSSGSATATSDGFTLAGISDPEVGVQGEVHSHSMNVRVPNDSSTGYVSVLASVSLPSITSGGNAEITTTVTCNETGASIRGTKIITQGSSNLNVVLVPTQFLDGAGTANNTLVVTFERRPAQGNDTAGYQSLIIHNVSINLRRYNKPTSAQSDSFRAY